MTKMKTPWTFEPVSGPFGFTEGPVWDGSGVLFVDMPSSRIMRYDPANEKTTTFADETHGANGLALDEDGRLYVSESAAGRVVRYDPDGSRTVLADTFNGDRLNSPNDMIVDGQGRIWFTDPRYGDRNTMALAHDSVYRLDPGAAGGYSIARVVFDTTRPNGLALSRDEATLYVAESPPAPAGVRQLRAYPVLADGTLGTMRVLHDFGPHRGIDGMWVDRGGNIVAAAGWATSGPGPRIVVFGCEGAVQAEHPMPAEPTNLCFDSRGRMLYVTANDGRLYRARLDH